ncbi:MAG: DUF937 domain-containing protein, partial [Bacteroidota bacterium]
LKGIFQHMNLFDLLQGQVSEDMISQLSQHIGASPEQTSQATQGILATLVGGLANNASTEGGLSALAAALDRDHDGSILDDIMGMVGGMMSGEASGGAANGAGIIGHILGDNQSNAAAQIGQSAGISTDQVMRLMPILAPIVMNVIGRARSSEGLDLGGLAGMLMGGAQQAQQSGMGDLIGSVLGQVLGGGGQQQQSGGDLLGGLIGGFLGKK